MHGKPPLGLTARAKIVGVVDGDTVDVELRVPARIRLLDCWAKESRTTDATEKVQGVAAKEHLEQLANDRHGQVFIPTMHANCLGDVFSFGRALGRVWLDGDDQELGTLQVLSGHAASHKGGRLGE